VTKPRLRPWAEAVTPRLGMIRPLSSSDAAIYRAVRLQSLWEQPPAFSTSPMDEPDLATTGLRLSPRHDHCFFGWFVGDQLVGIVRFFRHEASNERHRAQLGGLYVQPKFRHQGHGRQLLEAVLDRAGQTAGIERIGLHVVTTQKAAIHLFEHLGFVRYGTETDAFSNAGVLHDEHLMSLDLRKKIPESPALTWRLADSADCPLLAEFNQQLTADEGRGPRLTISELRQRLEAWLADDHRAVIFETGGKPVAYALFREDAEGIALRQFFVTPNRREAGIERQAAGLLLADIWAVDKPVTVEAAASPLEAPAFWRALGFKDRSITLERLPKTPQPRD